MSVPRVARQDLPHRPVIQDPAAIRRPDDAAGGEDAARTEYLEPPFRILVLLDRPEAADACLAAAALLRPRLGAARLAVRYIDPTLELLLQMRDIPLAENALTAERRRLLDAGFGRQAIRARAAFDGWARSSAGGFAALDWAETQGSLCSAAAALGNDADFILVAGAGRAPSRAASLAIRMSAAARPAALLMLPDKTPVSLGRHAAVTLDAGGGDWHMPEGCRRLLEGSERLSAAAASGHDGDIDLLVLAAPRNRGWRSALARLRIRRLIARTRLPLLLVPADTAPMHGEASRTPLNPSNRGTQTCR